MEKEVLFSRENCQILSDDSCCLNNLEQQELEVLVVPFWSKKEHLKEPLKKSLNEKEFVFFVGTTPSISNINFEVKNAVRLLDKEDKCLSAKKRVKILNTCCFSGGLGLFLSFFSDYLKRPRSPNEVEAFVQFLTNHIAHFFVEPSSKRWNHLITIPRIGKVNYNSGKFRGNKGVYSHIADSFHEYAYNRGEKVWVCASDQSKHEAQDLARHVKHKSPEVELDLSHDIAENAVENFSEEIIACFFLSLDFREDAPSGRHYEREADEIERKRQISRRNITELTRISEQFKKNPSPSF